MAYNAASANITTLLDHSQNLTKKFHDDKISQDQCNIIITKQI